MHRALAAAIAAWGSGYLPPAPLMGDEATAQGIRGSAWRVVHTAPKCNAVTTRTPRGGA